MLWHQPVPSHFRFLIASSQQQVSYFKQYDIRPYTPSYHGFTFHPYYLQQQSYDLAPSSLQAICKSDAYILYFTIIVSKVNLFPGSQKSRMITSISVNIAAGDDLAPTRQHVSIQMPMPLYTQNDLRPLWFTRIKIH